MEKLNHIDPSALYALLCDYEYIGTNHPRYDWKILENQITSSDPEDGGADHRVILQHLPSGRFYETSYSDWDIDNTRFDRESGKIDGRCDIHGRLYEVYPKVITKTIYVRNPN